MTSALIDSKLFIKHALTGTIETNENFGNKPENKAHFATDLLLYDQVIIPTHDFGVIPILIDWLGIKTFLDAIDTNSLSFLHRHGYWAMLAMATESVSLSFKRKILHGGKRPYLEKRKLL